MNLSNQTTTTPLAERANFFGQTMIYLGLALASSAGGVFAGFYLLPPALRSSTGFMLLMFIVTLGLVFTARRWSTGRFGYLGLVLFAAILGVTLVPLLSYAALTAGATIIGKALLSAVAMYIGLAIYGLTTHRDLSGLGGFLMAGLIGLISVSIISFVLQLFGISVWTSGVELAVSGFGIVLFGGYTMYDFQMILRKNLNITPIEAAIKLFLDFILLFEYILRFMLAGRG